MPGFRIGECVIWPLRLEIRGRKRNNNLWRHEDLQCRVCRSQGFSQGGKFPQPGDRCNLREELRSAQCIDNFRLSRACLKVKLAKQRVVIVGGQCDFYLLRLIQQRRYGFNGSW